MQLFTRAAKCTLLVATVFAAIQSGAQDLHFSQYYMQPSTLNPGLVGNYDGTFRVGAIYREQWASAVGKGAFRTVGVDADFCMLEGYLKTDKLAIGVGFFNDRSGDAGLSVLNASLTLAYHKGFGKKGQHRLSLGLQGAYLQKRIENPVFSDQFLGHNQLIGNSAENYSRGFYKFDFNVGLYWRSNINDRIKIGVGCGAYHLITPTQSIVRSQTNGTTSNSFTLPRKFNADLSVEAFFGKEKKVSLTPECLFLYQQPFMEITPGLSVSYYFNTGFRNNNSISVGSRFRLGGTQPDAVIPMVGAEFRNIRLAFGYDVNISKLKQSTSNKGAFEISLAYVGESIKSFKASKSLPSRRF